MADNSWKGRLDKAISVITDIYHVLQLLKIQLLVGIISIILLLIPGQILEIYRFLSEDFFNRWPQAVMATLGVGFLTFMLWYSARWMTLNEMLIDLNASTLRSWLVRWLPRLFAIAPGISVGVLLLFTPGSVGALLEGDGQFWIRMTGLIILFMTVLFFLFTIFRTQLGGKAGVYEVGQGSFGVVALRIAQILPLVLFVLVLISPIGFPTFVGTLFITTVFIGLLTFLLSWSSLFSRRTGFPLTLFLFGLAITWSFFDTNDNHEVRKVAIQGDGRYPQIAQAFDDWLKSRPDFQAYRDRGLIYPIYVIAAEGGGIYAAHHAATFLARAQDLCPNFARHVFAISGVSGGSLGSSIFTGLLRDPNNKDAVATGTDIVPCKLSDGTLGPLETVADNILSTDLLSPLAAATLIKDVPQRFWPWPIGSFDRARALEDGVQVAWRREGQSDGVLDEAVIDAWSPQAIVPALVLNTTHVSSGERVATSPISLVWSGRSIETTRGRYLDDGEGLSLLSAAVLSARFTYITPAGTLYLASDFLEEGEKAPKIRLVDGGYFENSGVDTAIDIVEAVRPIARAAGADIRLISFQYITGRSQSQHFLGETLSPIRALLATRVNRGVLASERAQSAMVGFCPLDGEPSSQCDDFIDINDPVRISYIHDRQGALPLGWLLSKRSREIIRAQVGWPHLCNYITGYVGPDPQGDDSLDHDNDCIMRFIQIEMERGVPEGVQMPDWNNLGN